MLLSAAAQLSQLTRSVKAGGPGSGRKPGFAWGAKNPGFASMHRSAIAHGFQSKGGQDIGHGRYASFQQHYEHPETGHKLTIERPGPADQSGRHSGWSLSDKNGNHLEDGDLPRGEVDHEDAHDTIGWHLQNSK